MRIADLHSLKNVLHCGAATDVFALSCILAKHAKNSTCSRYPITTEIAPSGVFLN